MALQLKFAVYMALDSKAIYFKETTGIQSLENPGGWYNGTLPVGQTENDAINDVIDHSITFIFPDGNEYVITSDNPNMDVLPDELEGDNGERIVELMQEDFESMPTDTFKDGVYTIIYNVDTNSSTYTTREYVLFAKATECCVNTMFSKLDVCNCLDCEGIDNALKAESYYKAAMYAAQCGQQDKANKLISYVNKICKNLSNCNCNG